MREVSYQLLSIAVSGLGVGDLDRLYKNSTVDGACRRRSQVSRKRYGPSSGQFWVALYSRTRRRGEKGNREPQLEFRGFPHTRVDRGSLRGTLDGPTTTHEDDAINPKVPLSKGSMWKMKAACGTWSQVRFKFSINIYIAVQDLLCFSCASLIVLVLAKRSKFWIAV